ncbi:MAG TPA: HEAT repeat domain-containing protein [Kofleriaceae bacterium]|nr:HEAT repeat domain-containing protein [Kofleriaceae bacterium]
MRDRDALIAALGQAGYTPGRKDVPPLVALLAGDDAHATAVRRALARADAAVVTGALAPALAAADDGGAARLIGALGDAAGRHPPAQAALIAALDDARPRVRRAAVGALGKLGGDDARAALCAYWDRDLPADHRRATAEALGKVGGDEARRRLAAADTGDDALLAQRRARGLLIAARDDEAAPSEVALDVAPPGPVALVARCRAGLETVLAGELADLGLAPERLGPGRVLVELTGPLTQAYAARTMLGAGALIALPTDEREPAAAIARALASPAAAALLAAWTRGPIRWRLDFERGGHRRALVWDVAARVQALAPALLNQPRATTWDVVVTDDERHLELRPRRFTDERFGWRVADVPAASHPTIAAALARVAGANAGELVWDPFVGSGAELCERARLGPARLLGTDLDERALAAARANLAAAGRPDAELIHADALTHAPPPVGLIITNPPMGRRIRGDAGGLLERFAERAPARLTGGGRLVWLTPASERTSPALRRAGLTLGFARDVDLGGYEARLERWDRPT